jgi:hypothetical protein
MSRSSQSRKNPSLSSSGSQRRTSGCSGESRSMGIAGADWATYCRNQPELSQGQSGCGRPARYAPFKSQHLEYQRPGYRLALVAALPREAIHGGSCASTGVYLLALPVDNLEGPTVQGTLHNRCQCSLIDLG